VDSIFRRKSGVYFARLVVPTRLRLDLGKTELVASTGVRDLPLAKIVGTEILASWRKLFRDLDGLAPVDLVQLNIGSPALGGTGFLPLRDASIASGIDVESLLRHATEGQLRLYFLPGLIEGFVIPYGDLERDFDEFGGGMVVPPASQMPGSALATHHPGTLRLFTEDVQLIGPELTAGDECRLALLELPNRPAAGFAPTGGARVNRETVSVSVVEIESLRRVLAARITPAQLADAQQSRVAVPLNKKAACFASAAVTAFMADRAKSCSPDQARRIRAGCDLFVELTGDRRLRDIDRDLLRRYRDDLLPAVPANENKIRLQHKTKSIKESILAVAGTDWPRISSAESTKRMQWLCGMFEWLTQEKWIADDPAVGLGVAARGKKGPSDHSKRDLFTREELKTIFTAPWFASGSGDLTKAGTYREFLPFYYWLPLLGLYTGARINELCQLALSDLRQSDTGVWFIDINEDDEEGLKKVKNSSSTRKIPIHSELVRLGLIEWRNRLQAEGYARLFPELSHDETKGYSKAAVRWFSSYLRRLGWKRNGRKVFHSFRHTLSSECLNVLGLSEAVTAQISGHKRSMSVLGETYRKDVLPDELVSSVERLHFDLPPVAEFDGAAGLLALQHALERKHQRKDSA
jgi:integrase